MVLMHIKVYPMSRTNRNTDKKISKVKWDRALHRMMVCQAKDKRQKQGNGKTHLVRALLAATDAEISQFVLHGTGCRERASSPLSHGFWRDLYSRL